MFRFYAEFKEGNLLNNNPTTDLLTVVITLNIDDEREMQKNETKYSFWREKQTYGIMDYLNFKVGNRQ